MAHEYEMMVQMRENAEPMIQEEFDKKLDNHYKFINSGGAGYDGVNWQTYSTNDDSRKGLIIGVYTGSKGTQGEQFKASHSNLQNIELENIFLTYADLVGVLCKNKNLKNIDLTGSLLVDSDFSGSDFEGANLSYADFSRSRMKNCNFKGANLTGTDLENVDLTGSDLIGAILEETRFPGTIMTNVKK